MRFKMVTKFFDQVLEAPETWDISGMVKIDHPDYQGSHLLYAFRLNGRNAYITGKMGGKTLRLSVEGEGSGCGTCGCIHIHCKEISTPGKSRLTPRRLKKWGYQGAKGLRALLPDMSHFGDSFRAFGLNPDIETDCLCEEVSS